MPYLRQCFFALLTFSLLALAFCSATANARVPRSPSPRDQRKFQELLNSIDPTSLNEGLHDHIDKYKPGVYQEDKTALAVVHQQTPEVVSISVDLAKRQAGSSTNSTGIATSKTTVTTEETSTSTSSFTSTSVTTQSSGSSSFSGTKESSSVPTSHSGTVQSSTSTSPSETGSTSTQTTPTSTSEGSSTPTNSGSQSSNLSPTTSLTSLDIFTTTLPNGRPTTVTQTTVVPAGGLPDQTGGGSTKTGGTASLQTNGAVSREVGTNVIMGMMGILFLGIL